MCKPGGDRKITKIQGEKGVVYSESEIAETFAESYEQQFSPNQVQPITTQIELRRRAADYIHHHTTFHEEHIELTDIVEVTELISKLKVKKASGYDNISNIALKNLPNNVLILLTEIFNASLKTHHFPKPWKHSIIKAIYKNGNDPLIPSSYRPISLLTSTSKVFERIIVLRLDNYIDQNNILTPDQHGFRREHSCVTQLLRVTEYITDAFNHREYVAAAFFDISKAFDKCDFPTLINKLIDLNFPPHYILFFSDYITDRTFQVKIGDTLSSIKNILASVLQGSVVGPELFKIYINDFPAPQAGIIAKYADDTAILCAHKNASHAADNLQETTDEILDWCEDSDVKLNNEKCQFAWFTKCKKIPRLRRLHVGNHSLIPVNKVKYLGCFLNKTMSFTPHIKYVRNKANNIIGALNKITFPQAKLSVKNKILFYKSIIRPTLLYASPVWAHACKSNIKSLQIGQNAILRKLLRAPWFVRNRNIRNDLKISHIFKYIKRLNRNQFDRMNESQYQHIRDIVNYCERPTPRTSSRTVYRRPKQIFHLPWGNL